jgi:MFS family permease
MLAPMRRVVHESVAALRAVLANRDLLRVELARAVAATSMFAYTVAFAVLAYRAGGASAVGLLALVRMVPPALLSSPLAVLADRYPRRAVMIAGDLARALVLVATAIVASLGLGTAAVLALAALVSMVGVASGPARAALVPTLARTPDELAAANVVGTSTENLAGFAGPIAGGVLFAIAGAEVTFSVCAAGALLSAALLARVHEVRSETAARARRQGAHREILAGFAAIGADRRLGLVTALYGAQTAATGALSVLMVICAFELLDFGEEGVGFVNAATSVGSLVGGVVALAVVAIRRPGSALGAGLVMWGLPAVVVGLAPEPLLALVLFALVGLADAVVDVVGFTLLQRVVPDEVAARVFGALSTILFAAFGLGALAGPLIVELLGVRTGLVVGGLVIPVVTLLAWPALRWLDRNAAEDPDVALLRRVPMLAMLGESTLAELAAGVGRRPVPVGETVFREGDVGDRFYVVADGLVRLTRDGAEIATAEAGDFFGEVALLHDVPRTATAIAAEDTSLVALERDAFLAAVNGDVAARRAADEIVGARVGGLLRVAAATR